MKNWSKKSNFIIKIQNPKTANKPTKYARPSLLIAGICGVHYVDWILALCDIKIDNPALNPNKEAVTIFLSTKFN